MKRKLLLIIPTIAAMVIGVVGMSAFEAHVINVTAHIENALNVPISSVPFGTVFPEEVLNKTISVGLSTSFLDANQTRLDDVSYVIKQKPKCVSNSDSTIHPQVTENADGIFACPVGSTQMNLLCPFLSKHSENANDTSIDAFHGPIDPALWTDTVSTQYEAVGHLTKADPSTNWTIDLHAPCFQGSCAQDNVVPAAYQEPANLEGTDFGCDLWIEANGFSTPQTPPTTLTVTKILSPNTDPGKFNLQINTVTVGTGANVGDGGTTGAITETAGSYTVGETAGTATNLANYTTVISGDCSSSGNITLAAGDQKTCTITNTRKAPLTQTITVHKVVENNGVGTLTASDFHMTIDGGVVAQDSAITETVGNHTVSEVFPNVQSQLNYVKTYSGDCDSTTGVVALAAGQNKTCTVTNTYKVGTITVHKDLENPGNLSTTQTAGGFQMQIDGVNVAQDTPIAVKTGNHTVSEVDSQGDVVTYSASCPAGVANVTLGANTDCTVTNTIPFGTITVNKIVDNSFGGNDLASSFNLFVHAVSGNVSMTNTVSKNFAPGSYDATEGGHAGYSATFAGNCNSSGHITLAAGDNQTCTITNHDQVPHITLIKNVVGGTASPDDFSMTIDGGFTANNSQTAVNSNTPHVINEGSQPGYTFTSMTGSGDRGAVCPASLGGSVTLQEGENLTCTITNTHP